MTPEPTHSKTLMLAVLGGFTLVGCALTYGAFLMLAAK